MSGSHEYRLGAIQRHFGGDRTCPYPEETPEGADWHRGFDEWGAPIDRQPIATAPRDGRVIIVGDPEVGEYPMAWNAAAANGLFAGVVGMWEAADRSFTWDESNGCGPTGWWEPKEWTR